MPEATWLQSSNADIQAGAPCLLRVGFSQHALLHGAAELLVSYQETSPSPAFATLFPCTGLVLPAVHAGLCFTVTSSEKPAMTTL